MIWLQLGLREWGRGMLGTTRDRSGRRDFFFLTALLSATLVLGVLLLGTREGMLNRFIDVSLGTIEGHGIPIWVYARYLGSAGSEGDDGDEQGDVIDRRMADRIAPLAVSDGIQFYPYREVEYTQLRLPGYDPAFWAKAALQPWQEEGKPAPIQSRAVARDDPLWRLFAASDSGQSLPLSVVLNRELFKRHFNCTDYIQALADTAPPDALKPTAATPGPPSEPSSGDKLTCLDNGRLWLDVKVTPVKRELLGFDIAWAEPRIPAMEDVAMLVPLATFNALQMADASSQLRYYPEANGDGGQRIKVLGAWTTEPDAADNLQVQALIACLPRATIAGRRHQRIEFERAVPQAWVEQCAQHAGIALKKDGESPSKPFIKIEQSQHGHALVRLDAHSLRVPCDAIALFEHQELGCGGAAGDSQAKHVDIDLRDRIGGYRFAQLYVADRNTLLAAIERVSQVSNGVLTLRPEYQDAVIRFGFINDMIRVLRGAFVWVFSGLLLVLLMIQITLVITHRQHNYGVFIANGMAPGQVLGMVCLQVGLSYVVAFASAYAVFELIRALLLEQVEVMLAATNYRDHIAVTSPDLLPVEAYDLLLPAALGLLMTLLTALLILITVLRPWPWRGSPEPARMLYN